MAAKIEAKRQACLLVCSRYGVDQHLQGASYVAVKSSGEIDHTSSPSSEFSAYEEKGWPQAYYRESKLGVSKHSMNIQGERIDILMQPNVQKIHT